MGINIIHIFLKYSIYMSDSSLRKQSSEYIADLIGFLEYVNKLFNPEGNFN